MKSKRSASQAAASSAPNAKKQKIPVAFGTEDPSPFSTKQDRIAKLKQWFASSHFEGSNHLELDISEPCGNSLGCFARRAFKEQDLLFTVPGQCMIGLKDAEKNDTVLFLRNKLQELKLLNKVTVEFFYWVYLLDAKHKESSMHYIYLQSLGDKSPNILEWDGPLRNLLSETNLVTNVQALHASLQQYDEVLETVRKQLSEAEISQYIPAERFNYAQLLWAAGHYLSRRYPFHFSSPTSTELPDLFRDLLREPGFGNVGTLVPCLDILNHKHDTEYLSFHVHPETGALQVSSQVAVAAGSELFSNYGPLSNGQLMFAYGYAVPSNPHDEFMLKIKLPPSLAEQLSSSSSSSGEPQNNGLFALRRGGFHGIPKALFTTLKAMIKLTNPPEDEETDNNDDEEGDDAVVDEECLELLYNFLSDKMARLFGVYQKSLRAALFNDYQVDLQVHFPGIDEDGEVRPITAVKPATVSTLPLARNHSSEDAHRQRTAVSIAYYLAGQLEVLMEVLKDLQSMFSGGAEDEEGDDDDDGDDGEEDDEEDDDEE